jgi:hypothetical protein
MPVSAVLGPAALGAAALTGVLLSTPPASLFCTVVAMAGLGGFVMGCAFLNHKAATRILN